MKQAGSGAVTSEHPATKAWSTAFVVVQIALSLVLLVAATLFVRTLTNLQRQSLGVAVPVQQREPLGLLHRQALEHHGVNEAEDGGVGADAQRQRHRDHDRQPGAPPHVPQREAQVPED